MITVCEKMVKNIFDPGVILNSGSTTKLNVVVQAGAYEMPINFGVFSEALKKFLFAQ